MLIEWNLRQKKENFFWIRFFFEKKKHLSFIYLFAFQDSYIISTKPRMMDEEREKKKKKIKDLNWEDARVDELKPKPFKEQNKKREPESMGVDSESEDHQKKKGWCRSGWSLLRKVLKGYSVRKSINSIWCQNSLTQHFRSPSHSHQPTVEYSTVIRQSRRPQSFVFAFLLLLNHHFPQQSSAFQ